MNMQGLIISHRGIFNNLNIPENSLSSFQKAKNLNIKATGSGIVVSQNIAVVTSVEQGTVVEVTLQEVTSELH